MTTETTPTTIPDPAQLRAGLADLLREIGTFRTPQVEAAFRTVPRHLFLLWTGVIIHDDEPVEHLDLWLATVTDGFGRLSTRPAARESGLADPALRWAGAALYDGGTIAYITLRPVTTETDELGVVVHGPDSDKLATQITELLHRWNRERPAQPLITAQRAGTPDDELAHGHHIDKPNTRLTIAW